MKYFNKKAGLTYNIENDYVPLSYLNVEEDPRKAFLEPILKNQQVQANTNNTTTEVADATNTTNTTKSPDPTVVTSDPDKLELKDYAYGKWKTRGNPIMIDAFQRANDAYFKSTGKYLATNQTYRDKDEQQRIYNEVKAKNPNARVATPGSQAHLMSHGLGYSVDLPVHWNDPTALKYLNQEGFVNGISNDMNHFYHKDIIEKNRGWFEKNVPSVYKNYIKLYG